MDRSAPCTLIFCYTFGFDTPMWLFFFLGFPLVSSFVQVFEMLFVLILLSKGFNSIYACPRVHKTHNGHAFMISMNESKIYKRVQCASTKRRMH